MSLYWPKNRYERVGCFADLKWNGKNVNKFSDWNTYTYLQCINYFHEHFHGQFESNKTHCSDFQLVGTGYLHQYQHRLSGFHVKSEEVAEINARRNCVVLVAKNIWGEHSYNFGKNSIFWFEPYRGRDVSGKIAENVHFNAICCESRNRHQNSASLEVNL